MKRTMVGAYNYLNLHIKLESRIVNLKITFIDNEVNVSSLFEWKW